MGGLKWIGFEVGFELFVLDGIFGVFGGIGGLVDLGIVLGWVIEDYFWFYYVFVEGENSCKIDVLLVNFKNILDNLLVVVNNLL